jgi:hypothetical protein
MLSSLPGNKDSIFNSFAAFNSFMLVVYGNCNRAAKVSIIHISIPVSGVYESLQRLRLLNTLYSNHLSVRSLGYQAVKANMKIGCEVKRYWI